jgi:hypothetical protein
MSESGGPECGICGSVGGTVRPSPLVYEMNLWRVGEPELGMREGIVRVGYSEFPQLMLQF